jgi:hypothetical protein|uniref:Uncharacterized protein n=1 Tax=Picea glauca TaxID=3330 RepID=A0A124GP89_PICGL|nr:hypothetical protein ABT39_MTgene1062 [Picea glauca]
MEDHTVVTPQQEGNTSQLRESGKALELCLGDVGKKENLASGQSRGVLADALEIATTWVNARDRARGSAVPPMKSVCNRMHRPPRDRPFVV